MTSRSKTFKVADHVGILSVDFRPVATFSGTIPEPSQEQLNAWSVAMSQLAAEFSFSGDPNDMTAIVEFLATLDEDALNDQADRTAELHAALCSECPSKAQILELPPRHRQAFYGYLSGEFSPEGSAPAGKS